jgi:predicted RND superfamily exporter protein
MKRVADILVKYRIIFFSVSVILALLCGLMIPFVTINKDQSKYLAKDSNMSQGLEIINKEFPDPGLKDNFQIMFEGLTPSEKQIIYEELAGFDGVTSVEYDGERSATVHVNGDQLSLAIGKEGQNVRLAAKLTGCKIDIKGIKL